MDPVIGDLDALDDVVVAEPEFEPMEQLVDLGQREADPTQRRVREQTEPLLAPLARPAAVFEAPQLLALDAFGTPRARLETGCTEDSFDTA